MKTTTGANRAAPKESKPDRYYADERSVSVRLPADLDTRVKRAFADMARGAEGKPPNQSDALRGLILLGVMAWERGYRTGAGAIGMPRAATEPARTKRTRR